jgi:hypothetical protein
MNVAAIQEVTFAGAFGNDLLIYPDAVVKRSFARADWF